MEEDLFGSWTLRMLEDVPSDETGPTRFRIAAAQMSDAVSCTSATSPPLPAEPYPCHSQIMPGFVGGGLWVGSYLS